MNEVIGTILEAEARAEQIVQAAEGEAKRILAEGERAAERISDDAKRTLLSDREKAVAAAEHRGAERYRAITQEGKNRADALRASCAAKLPTAVKATVEKVFGA